MSLKFVFEKQKSLEKNLEEKRGEGKSKRTILFESGQAYVNPDRKSGFAVVAMRR